MKRETLEKIRNILEHLFELFIFILIMLITFGSLSVHAATVEPQGNLFFNASLRSTGQGYDYTQYVRVYTSDSANLKVAIVTRYNESSTYPTNDFVMYTVDSPSPSSIYIGNGTIYHNQNDKENKSFTDISNSAYWTAITLSDGTVVRCATGGAGNTAYTYEPTFPIYEGSADYPYIGGASIKTLTAFFEHLLVIGDIKPTNGGSIDNPDFEDTAYAFTGFTANNKMTATWTGTTDRSYLQDQEVEEYVRVSYGFAAKDAPDSIKQVDNDSKEYSTAAKSLTVKVSDLVPDDDSWFLRYVQVIPCYRQAGLGAWGDFYHGESSYVYFNADGSIDKIVAPYVKGSLSADMERPVIVLHEAANGNPTESDYSYFEFNNAREDYFFEMKGRWYTTNDFDIYRDKLVWKYKYSTLLKNDLSTWVTVADGKNSVGKFQFDILGKSSWENLITSYPVDDRNYIGGSYALVNKITGYSDAVDTLKMLLKQPYSLYNGYEVYVRYYRYDENGSIEYSKWTHFYNNLANSEGSSGSRLDDLDNMYSENQSDKGLTDDELSDLENTGNSRNDLDAVPKNNYDYSSLETATMNFFDLLTNFGSMLGQFPSMVTAVFGFLPKWLIGLIAVAIGAVIFCRFIGR